MIDALMESATVAVLFSVGLFTLAGVAALADLPRAVAAVRRIDERLKGGK